MAWPPRESTTCDQVMFWFGATSHKNRCTVGDEPWREEKEHRKTAE